MRLRQNLRLSVDLRSGASILAIIFLLLGLLGSISHSSAEIATGSSLSSDHFRILDSGQTTFGGTASASSFSFGLVSVLGNLSIGSSSFSLFALNSGFLYFPKVIAPTLNSATAGDAKVTLSWTAAQGFQGWNITSYNVCTSDGSYSCQDVGNVTSYIKTSLTNATTYTFKIQAKDFYGNVLAESNELSATPVASNPTPTPTPPPSTGGGGGGGGSYIPPIITGTGSIILIGTAYPNATINIFRDGSGISNIRANSKGEFNDQLDDFPAGPHSVGFNAEDSNGRKSITVTFTVNVPANGTVTLSQIIIPTTIELSSYQVNKGDLLRIFGEAPPLTEVNVHVASTETITKTVADSAGAYAIQFDTKPLAEDDHSAKSRALLASVYSPFSSVLQFKVGKGRNQLKSADLNKDGRVDIIDFSILLYWWNTSSIKGLGIADINDDGKVNIIDFSIMLFQWNG